MESDFFNETIKTAKIMVAYKDTKEVVKEYLIKRKLNVTDKIVDDFFIRANQEANISIEG